MASDAFKAHSPKIPVGDSSTAEDSTLARVEASLEAARRLLVDTQAQLDNERAQRLQHEQQVRQDMYLEMLQAKERSQRDIDRIERQLRGATKAIVEKEEAMNELQQRCEETTDSLSRQIVEVEAQKQDLQHLQLLNTTLEGDIEELRQIQTEVAVSRRPPGLPPAYGSLDEKDLPPYELHRDTGALKLATLKRAIRDRFDADTRRTRQLDANDVLFIDAPPDRGAQQLLTTSYALFNAAIEIQSAMQQSFGASCFDIDVTLRRSVCRAGVRESFVAARLANLVLEFAWRTIAMNEARPSTFSFSQRALSVFQTLYGLVDYVLLQALRFWNGEVTTNGNDARGARRNERRACEFQIYLSQLYSIDTSLRKLLFGSTTRKQLFYRSIAFLEEAVEYERTSEANRPSDNTMGPVTEAREPSVISSAGDDTDNDSESETTGESDLEIAGTQGSTS